jgi:peptidyl-tRNA hydrolase
MSNIRHVVVVRKDLNMTAGLMAAQVAHISDAFMRKGITDKKEFSVEEKEWMWTPYISVLSVDNNEELDILVDLARRDKIECHIWKDLIYSQNLKQAIPNITVGASFGPCDYDRLKAITGNLPLA